MLITKKCLKKRRKKKEGKNVKYFRDSFVVTLLFFVYKF